MTPEQKAREWALVTRQDKDLPHRIRDAIARSEELAYLAGYHAALDEAARVAETYWKQGKNAYARHAGRAVETRIRALKEQK